MNIRPIRNDEDHRAALAVIEACWGAAEGSQDGDRLDVLLALVEIYEAKRWPIDIDEIAPTDGLAPVVHDTELHRGVVVHGRVTDRSTGRPIRARVIYAPLMNNPHFDTTPGYDKPRTRLTR